MAGHVVWHGGQFRRELVAGLKQNMSAAAIYLASEVKADISQPGTLRYSPIGKKGKASKRQKTIYNFTHSRPGNPPYKQTGRLRASITWELVGLIARVGTNVVYGRAQELGYAPRHLAARPYLRPNLAKRRAILAAIITRRIKAGQLPRIRSNQYRSGHFGAGARAAGYT